MCFKLFHGEAVFHGRCGDTDRASCNSSRSGNDVNPLIHDKVSIWNANIWRDRDFIYGNGTQIKQRLMTSGTMSYEDTVKYITEYVYGKKGNRTDEQEEFDKENFIVGEVKMDEYIVWLMKNGGEDYCLEKCNKK